MTFDDLIKANAAGYATPGLQKKIGYKYTTADGSNNVPMSEPGGHSAVSWANIFKDFNTGATRTPNTVAQINAGKPNVTQTAVSQILSSSPALAGAANDFQPIKFDLSGGLPPAPNLSALNTGVNTAQRWSGNNLPQSPEQIGQGTLHNFRTATGIQPTILSPFGFASVSNTNSGEHYLGDETGDRTAEFTKKLSFPRLASRY